MERRIQIKAGIYTAVICFMVFIFMLIYRVTVEVEETVKFNEVVFVPPIEEQIRYAKGGGAQGLGKSTVSARVTNLPKINLPTRFVLTEEEILPHRFAEKIDVIERPGKETEEMGFTFGRGGSDASLGKEIKPEVGVSASGKSGVGEIRRDFGSGVKSKLSYHIEWEGKINRVKVSGELPRFPHGVNESAVVRFKLIVLPDGTIERIFPLEKANPEFERFAFEALRTWRFNPIAENVKQNGIVTFNFRFE